MAVAPRGVWVRQELLLLQAGSAESVPDTHPVLCFSGRSVTLSPSLVLTLPCALAVLGDAAGAVDTDEDRPAVGPSPAAPSTADGSSAPALPALSSSREAEETPSGTSAPPARAAVLALDALPPG